MRHAFHQLLVFTFILLDTLAVKMICNTHGIQWMSCKSKSLHVLGVDTEGHQLVLIIRLCRNKVSWVQKVILAGLTYLF